MGFKAGVIRGPVLINDILAANTNIGATSNTGTISIGNATSTGVNIVAPTNINVAGALNTAIGSTSNTGTVSIGNASSTSVTVIGPVNINTSTNANTAINSTSSTGTVTIGNTSSGVVTINSGTAGILVGTTANAHASTFGSTNSTSSTTVQSGSGALNVTATGGALTINSGTGALGISTDASATTVSFATGGAVKAVTLGSTNTTSSTAIKSGSGNVAINSGLTIDSSGRNYNTVQPAFLYRMNTTVNTVTGDGTDYTVVFDTSVTNQGSVFNGTTFTAPIAGNYFLFSNIMATGITTHTVMQVFIVANGVTYNGTYFQPANNQSSGFCSGHIGILVPMTASSTATFHFMVSGGTKVVGVDGGNEFSWAGGYLVC